MCVPVLQDGAGCDEQQEQQEQEKQEQESQGVMVVEPTAGIVVVSGNQEHEAAAAAIQKVFSLVELIYQICSFIEGYNDIESLFKAIEFEPGANRTWILFLKRKLKSHFDILHQLWCTKTLNYFRYLRGCWWATGAYPREYELISNLRDLFGRMIILNEKCNRRSRKLFNLQEQEQQKSRGSYKKQKPVYYIMKLDMIRKSYGELTHNHNFSVCIHLKQDDRLFADQLSETFCVVNKDTYNMKIDLRFFPLPLPVVLPLHVSALRDMECNVCGKHIVNDPDFGFGFTTRTGTNRPEFHYMGPRINSASANL